MAFDIHRLVVSFIIALNLNYFVSALRVITEPRVVTDETDFLNVTCLADEPAYSTRRILTIEIVNHHQDELIVRMDDLERLQSGRGFSWEKHQIEGNIDKNTTRQFLTMIVDRPSIEDAFTYKCRVFFVDEDRRIGDVNVEGNVTFQGCPGWSRYQADRTCLKIFGKDDRRKYLNWDKARKWCQRYGGDLVRIRDEDKNNFVLDMSDGLRRGPYIGVINVGNDSNLFKYVDGSDLDNYHPWSDETQSIDNQQNCVFLNSGIPSHGKWGNAYCRYFRPYVCSVSSH